MSSVQVRPFRRDDRDQLTRLVNAHAEAVVPGMSASVRLRLAGRHRPGRVQLRRLPGLPARRRLPRTDAHRARVDPDLTAGGGGRPGDAG